MHLSNAGEARRLLSNAGWKPSFAGLVVVPGAPGATLAKARRLLGGVRREYA